MGYPRCEYWSEEGRRYKYEGEAVGFVYNRKKWFLVDMHQFKYGDFRGLNVLTDKEAILKLQDAWLEEKKSRHGLSTC